MGIDKIQRGVAVRADIEGMFYQVFVAEKRSLLSFLWLENGNCDLSPQSYHVNVHVCGRASFQVAATMHCEKLQQIMKINMCQMKQLPSN